MLSVFRVYSLRFGIAKEQTRIQQISLFVCPVNKLVCVKHLSPSFLIHISY